MTQPACQELRRSTVNETSDFKCSIDSEHFLLPTLVTRISKYHRPAILPTSWSASQIFAHNSMKMRRMPATYNFAGVQNKSSRLFFDSVHFWQKQYIPGSWNFTFTSWIVYDSIIAAYTTCTSYQRLIGCHKFRHWKWNYRIFGCNSIVDRSLGNFRIIRHNIKIPRFPVMR